MRLLKRVTLFAVLLALLCSLMPPAAPQASAASATPMFELKTTTATRAFIDVNLPFDDFKSGGPFTMTCEWKSDFKSQIAVPSGWESRAFILIIGTVYGTTNDQKNNEISVYKSTDWQKVTMTFENVGYYNVSGNQIPGNILRFKLNYSIGTVNFRNVLIKNAAGQVVYDINNDPDVQALMGQMQDTGETITDLSNLASINWTTRILSNQFETGNYTAHMRLDGGAGDTSTTTKNPVFGSTTKPSTSSSTTKPTTSSTTSKRPTTSSSTTSKRPTTSSSTVKPSTSSSITPGVEQDGCESGNHTFVDGFCFYCAEPDPNYVEPCHHKYSKGKCILCGQADPNYKPGHTHTYANGKCTQCGITDPNYEAPASTDSGENGSGSLTFWLVFGGGILLFGGIMAVMVILSNKKRNEE